MSTSTFNRPTRLSDWYYGISIPAFANREQTIRFASSVNGFAVSFLSENLKCTPSVYFTDEVDTAAIDITNNSIYISTKYIDPDPSKRINPNISSELTTLEAMIGSTIHELFHIKHTTKTIEEVVAIAGINNEVFTTIFNVVEDLYIDNDACKNIGRLAFAYSARVNYLFPPANAATAINNLPTEINCIFDVVEYVNVCIMLKNFENRTLWTMMPPNLDKFVQVRKLFAGALSPQLTIFDRINLSVKIYKFLTADLPEDEASRLKQSGDIKSGEDGESGDNGLSDEEREAIGKMLKAAADFENADSIKSVSQAVDSSKVDFTTTKMPNGNPISIVTIEADEQTFSTFGISGSGNYTVKPDDRFVDFAALIRARSIVNHPSGQARDKGRKISRLQRIVIDSKIFSDPQQVDSMGQQEIIILVDLSGSMRSNQKIDDAISAAYGAAIGLEEGRHRVAVYGHTAELASIFGGIDVVIVKLKDFDEPSTVLEKRMKAVMDFGENLMSSNADDIAIREVSGAFSVIQNSKTLIVISDGMPSASCSYGVDGTKDSVENVRQMGIKVLSISIESAAVYKNNVIYGADFNYDSSDPGIVFKIIANM